MFNLTDLPDPKENTLHVSIRLTIRLTIFFELY
jgi:hypothetical protein